MSHGPRIYNLFPLLAGAIDAWTGHLPRIAAMGFDWIFVNPIHYPGFSGSLYAIKDLERLHPVIQGASDEAPDRLLARFVEAAEAHGLSVMLDLVINHTAKDALLVEAAPDWFRREPDGSLRSPRAVDPLDPRNETVWGDLAEIDYDDPARHDAQVAYWAAYVRRLLALGIRGFRCDAAYQVPAGIWSRLIAEARRQAPGCLFAAETLGCTPEQVLALGPCGFSHFFNSVKWWDGRADWLLEQYALYRPLAPTIGFPESHDTPRLASELRAADPDIDGPTIERHYRLRYLLAASFASGVMMPMGYEYGLGEPLDVVGTRPGDWHWQAGDPPFDLTGYIAAVNAMKAATPALGVEGAQFRVTAPDAGLVGLLRVDGDDPRAAAEAAITLINPDADQAHGLAAGGLIAAAGGYLDGFEDVSPHLPPAVFEAGRELTLAPLEGRVFRVRRRARPKSELKGPSASASERRLRTLAAQRVAIEGLDPEIDGGRFPVKRVVGDTLEASADIFCDGHDVIDACLVYRRQGERAWREAPMAKGENDRWTGRIPLSSMGRWEYSIEAWRDLFASWRIEVTKKLDADQPIALELIEGRRLVEQAAAQAGAGADGRRLAAALAALDAAGEDEGARLAVLLAGDLLAAMRRAAPRTNLTRYPRTLEVVVDRTAARFSAWYEIFPRSQSGDPARHGTFDDVIARLPYIRELGFDVLYFTPIHPIGETNRKGRNNSLTPQPGDPGSPYAIGSAAGGHDALHPELGSFEDFRRLLRAAARHGLEVALDFAIQCAPDHPWLKQHPEWFDWRPDGSIKFAENPPKKYEDIVNVHFYREALPAIWYALRDVVLFWVGQGVKIFRVDNPHTKPLPFWEWMIREVQDRHPDVIFLSEAFTRPKMMKRLAKLGFTQSYTYFTWRNTKAELTEYMTELTGSEMREYYRPNFFTNTPDINPLILQSGKRSAFQTRFVLAATLAGAYGIYNGLELCEGTPVPGKEEYLNSEKYEIKAWDWERPGHIRALVARVNRLRRDNPALQDLATLRFYNAWNDAILYYGKLTPARDNLVLVAVNLDPDQAHGAHFEVPLWELGLPDEASIEVEDLLAGHRFTWHGKVQHLWLDPAVNPVALWRLIPPGGG